MMEYQVIASSSTYHQTLTDDERKKVISLFQQPSTNPAKLSSCSHQFLLRTSLLSPVFIPFRFSFTVPRHSSQVVFGTMSVTLHDAIYQSFKQERNG